MLTNLPKTGYVSGKASRLNERVVDSIWLGFLKEYCTPVEIPPFAFIRLFGGSVRQWAEDFPAGLDSFVSRLDSIRKKYECDIIYMNIPFMVPYLLLARSVGRLDIRFLFFGHSVGLQYWLKQWIAAAPWFSASDILICPTGSCRRALLNISPCFEPALCVPHSIRIDETAHEENRERSACSNLLCIGRIEDVKNIDIVLDVFVLVRKKRPDATLTIAGEYTGNSAEQIRNYRQRISSIIEVHGLSGFVNFTGPVEGEAKVQCFREAGILINLSTDPGETFGYNLIEAKSYGLPVVCTQWDGFAEVVDDGGDGILIDCTWQDDMPHIDTEQAASAIIQLLDDDDLYMIMSENAIGNVQKWDYRNNLPRITEAVKKSLGGSFRFPDTPADTAAIPLNKISNIYNTGNLQKLDCWQDKSLIEILADDHYIGLKEWMPKVKPVIRHFTDI